VSTANEIPPVRPTGAGRPEAAAAPGAGHRERLLDAMAESIRVHGYRGTTVADVVRRARTSRRTFYQHFEDREACFLELFDVSNEMLGLRISEALRVDASWEEQVDQAVSVYIDEVAAEPALTIAFTRELTALGDVGTLRQRNEIDRFSHLLIALVEMVNAPKPQVVPMQMATAIMITGGLRELISYAIENDQDLTAMKAPASGLIKSVLDPAHGGWSGPAAA
jgi:AcrR family transcriptional regulator